MLIVHVNEKIFLGAEIDVAGENVPVFLQIYLRSNDSFVYDKLFR